MLSIRTDSECDSGNDLESTCFVETDLSDFTESHLSDESTESWSYLKVFLLAFAGFIIGSLEYLTSTSNIKQQQTASKTNSSRIEIIHNANEVGEYKSWMDYIPTVNTTTTIDSKKGSKGGQWTWCTHLVGYGPNFDQGMAAFISGILQPKSTLEFGCGIGMYINYIQHNSVARDKDNLRFIGIEPESMMEAGVFGSEPYLATQAAMNIFEVDQSVLDSFGTFEVVFSSEVAEHIPFEFHDTMIDFLVNKTEKYLVFGAARRGQGGTGHIAMRDQADWIKDFEKAGMIYSKLLSKRVKAAAWNGWDKGQNTFVMINAKYHAQFEDFDNQFDVSNRRDVGSIFPQFQEVYNEMIEKDTCNVNK